MRSCLMIATLLLVPAIGPAALGQDGSAASARFNPFNDCKPIRLYLGDLGAGAKALGLSKDRMRVAIESRLRSAQLYDSEAGTYLYVVIRAVGDGFEIDLGFAKYLYDPKTSSSGYEITWIRGGIGTVGADGQGGDYVISRLSETMDDFLVWYLRVNEQACGSR